jgi:hypothetical protein
MNKLISEKTKFQSVFGWVFWSFFLIAAFGSLFMQERWYVFTFLLMWILLLPPAFNYFVSKANLNIPYWLRILIVILLVFVTPYFSLGKSEGLVNEWYYGSYEDKMDWWSTVFSAVDANQKLSFSFPYNWWSKATFIIRNYKGEDEVLLRVDKGQFKKNSKNNQVRIKFDESESELYNITFPLDGSVDTIFIGDVSRIKKMINESSTALIQAEFYQDWLHVMEFNVSWLRFD